jgi:hypothetical protein
LQQLSARQQAGPLIAFYNSLDARQKAKFDRFRERRGCG